MNHGTKLIAEFIQAMQETYAVYQIELIDEEEFSLTKIAIINITLYSCEHYEEEQMEEAIALLHHSNIISKEEYWQIKARFRLYKNAA